MNRRGILETGMKPKRLSADIMAELEAVKGENRDRNH